MFDLLTAKARLNLLDTSKDALVTSALAATLALVETYCDRHFMQAVESEEFVLHQGTAFQVSRYPITSVASVADSNGNIDIYTPYVVDKKAGIVFFDYTPYDRAVTINYTGGYTVLPPDLELAFWSVFDLVYPTFNVQAGGIMQAPSGSVIKSVAIQGVGTITYDTSGAATASAGAGSNLGGLIPSSSAAILDLYSKQRV